MNRTFHSVAVLGAGVMGAQIAAHLANAGLQVWLFDLGRENTLVARAIQALHAMQPPPLVYPSLSDAIIPATYAHNMDALSHCDWVIEAIAERLTWKHRVYEKIQPYLHPHAFLVSNTSGLQIEQLAEVLSPDMKSRFCGAHFFYPPRYMPLVELIPHASTSPEMLDQLEFFLVHQLGRNVVRVQDTPNFLANRMGFFGLLMGMHHAKRYGISLDVADKLLGHAIGVPEGAVFRTADTVGLDTFAHGIETMADQLGADPWVRHFHLPVCLKHLLEKGALGQKNQQGFYRYEGDKYPLVFDYKLGDYRPALGKPSASIRDMMALADRTQYFARIRGSELPEARFLWAVWRDIFHYAAYHMRALAEKVADIDLCMRWGFGWQSGIFEIWQQGGWAPIAEAIQRDIAAGSASALVPLPPWVETVAPGGPYTPQGSYAPKKKKFLARNQNRSRSIRELYARHWFPEPLLEERFPQGQTVIENATVRLWSQQEGIGILHFKTADPQSAAGALSPQLVTDLQDMLDRVTREVGAVIWWQPGGFQRDMGLNSADLVPFIQHKQWAALESILVAYQQCCLAWRTLPIPVIGAVYGAVPGHACEMLLYMDAMVASPEVYMGLTQVRMGLLPVMGGLTEMARRSSCLAAEEKGPVWYHLQRYADQLRTGQVSRSAAEARVLGYLREHDRIVAHPQELLWSAHRMAQSELELGYRPVRLEPILVGGQVARAALQAHLPMDLGAAEPPPVARAYERMLDILCGGAHAETGDMVDESWFFRLERAGFLELLQDPEWLDGMVLKGEVPGTRI